MTKQQIDRKIHFFNFEILELPGNSNSFRKHSDPYDVFNEIANLDLKGDHLNSRFKYFPNNDVSFLNDIEVRGDIILGRYAISRRSSLPELETGGVLKPLNIPRNSGLAEITHFIYYPAKDILGVEFNFFGPRANSLKNYLLEKSNNHNNPIKHIELYPILNQDLDTLLQEVGEINMFQMEIARNELSVIEELDRDLYSAFEAAEKVSDAESVEVILRKKKYSREGFPLPFSKNRLKELLSIGDNRQKINRMKVNAESKDDGENKLFDLLEDKMIVSKKVATLDERSRSVDPNSMYEKIEEAYNELRDNF